ncbi:hypothetical protein [Dolichospermum compactum]|uniref:Uncharacterized protein n=1 Tax=Dolichospermum compactum NIES-806 TaxID=1973481 RepID=A0A1Z4UYP6_9CYAN|nr:hypothetical protein [Dolichospermum compactum]BAZ84367.1 hypothetical protein NIES806_05530 [Dolichospermum compactum NIES-806]
MMKPKMAFSLSRTLNRLSIDYQHPRWWFDVLVIAMSYYITSWLGLKKCLFLLTGLLFGQPHGLQLDGCCCGGDRAG